MKKLDWHDIGTSVLGIFALVHTIYPNATGQAIVNAFQSGAWMSYAIDLAFATMMIRYQGQPKVPELEP